MDRYFIFQVNETGMCVLPGESFGSYSREEAIAKCEEYNIGYLEDHKIFIREGRTFVNVCVDK